MCEDIPLLKYKEEVNGVANVHALFATAGAASNTI
jgi:hypothetical protein